MDLFNVYMYLIRYSPRETLIRMYMIKENDKEVFPQRKPIAIFLLYLLIFPSGFSATGLSPGLFGTCPAYILVI